MRDPARILVVDDVADNVEILRMRLTALGYEVVVALPGNGAFSVPAAAATRSGRNEPERMAHAAAAALRAAAPATVPSAEKLPPPRRASEMFAGLLSRIDAIGESGLDGHELRELGLKNGNLTVNDERTGKRWTFRDISLSVERARGGGVEVTIGSDNAERPWGITASIVPAGNGYRKIDLEARRVAACEQRSHAMRHRPDMQRHHHRRRPRRAGRRKRGEPLRCCPDNAEGTLAGRLQCGI